MFDNPKKELRELEDQLLAAEMNHETAELNNEEFEELYDGILEEFGPRENLNGTTVTTSDPPIRNFANGYGKAVHTGSQGSGGDEILEEDAPAGRQKGVRGLVVLLCLECLAIAGLAVYGYMNGYVDVLTVLVQQLLR